MDRTKKAYGEYYKGLDTAIGGDERFLWVSGTLLKNTAGKTILDVGCGEGSLLRMLKDKGNDVFGIDVSESGQRFCIAKGIECAVIDISSDKFPLKDNAFDIVLCLETLEHIENPHHCIWEIKRVLKENGIFIVSIPNPKILHPYIYPGLFDVKNFKEFLRLNSFEIIKVKGWGQASSRRAAGMLHYLIRKRNLVMRKHTGTPLSYSYCLNFICVNRKKDKTLSEQLAEETRPGKKLATSGRRGDCGVQG